VNLRNTVGRKIIVSDITKTVGKEVDSRVTLADNIRHKTKIGLGRGSEGLVMYEYADDITGKSKEPYMAGIESVEFATEIVLGDDKNLRDLAQVITK
jgi:hypothetical protein